jgi:protease secretion system outer membrane protein
MKTSHIKIYTFVEKMKYIQATVLMALAFNVQAMTIEHAIESAVRLDPSLRSSKLNQLATGENIAIARARLLPQITLQGSSNELTQTTTQDLPNGSSASRSFTGPSVNHQFIIRQALIRPKELSSLRYAEVQNHYMELKYKYDVSELKLKVINVWIELLSAQEIVQTYARTLPYLEAAARQELVKFEQGEGTKDIAIEAHAQYENAKANHLQAEETLKAKQVTFEKLTSVQFIEIAEKKIVFEPWDFLDEVKKELIWNARRENSLEIKMADLQESMQLERVKIAEADHKPTLDLLAALNLAQNDATSTQGYQYKNKQIGIQYSIPLYAGGGHSASLKQAEYMLNAIKLDKEAILMKLEIEFENNWSQLIGGRKRMAALIQSKNAIDIQLKAVKKGYELGTKTISEVASIVMLQGRREIDLNTSWQELSKILIKLKFKNNQIFKE